MLISYFCFPFRRPLSTWQVKKATWKWWNSFSQGKLISRGTIIWDETVSTSPSTTIKGENIFLYPIPLCPSFDNWYLWLFHFWLIQFNKMSQFDILFDSNWFFSDLITISLLSCIQGLSSHSPCYYLVTIYTRTITHAHKHTRAQSRLETWSAHTEQDENRARWPILRSSFIALQSICFWYRLEYRLIGCV